MYEQREICDRQREEPCLSGGHSFQPWGLLPGEHPVNRESFRQMLRLLGAAHFEPDRWGSEVGRFAARNQKNRGRLGITASPSFRLSRDVCAARSTYSKVVRCYPRHLLYIELCSSTSWFSSRLQLGVTLAAFLSAPQSFSLPLPSSSNSV